MQINQGMMRALEAFQEAILMVDATDLECWTVLHVNKTFVEQTGVAASPRMLDIILGCEYQDLIAMPRIGLAVPLSRLWVWPLL